MNTRDNFIRNELWLGCRHRRTHGRPPSERNPRVEIHHCLIAIEEDPNAAIEVGAGGCLAAECPYVDREGVP